MAYAEWKDIEQVERYATRRYRSWDQRRIDHREKRLVRALFEEYHLKGTILDVPVGYGRFQSLLGEFGNVLASDVGFLPILYQKQRVGIAQESTNSAAENLPFKDKSIDVVFCFRLLQHMHVRSERIAILKEFCRVSRRWVIASVYISTPLHRLHRKIFPQQSRITMLTKREWDQEIDQAGLSLIRMFSVVPGLHAHRICLFSSE